VKETRQSGCSGQSNLDNASTNACMSAAERAYLNYYQAQTEYGDLDSAKQAIADLPMHERYLWNTLQHLKSALAEVDRFKVEIDVATFSEEDLDKAKAVLQTQAGRICELFCAVLGHDLAQQLITAAMRDAEVDPRLREKEEENGN